MSLFSAYFLDGKESPPTPSTVYGILPSWLSGTLFINGPGRFHGMSHLFDGLALLHSFKLRPNTPPLYQARYLRSASFIASEAAGGVPRNREFASSPGGFCGRIRTLAAGSSASDNANVALVPFRGSLYALTEAPVAWQIDKSTLTTIAPWSDAPFSCRRSIFQVAATTSAHVLHHEGGIPNIFNGKPFSIFLTTRYTFGFSSSLVTGLYEISLQSDDDNDGGDVEREEIRFNILPITNEAPAYMHSFTATATRVILTEAPMRFSLPSMLYTVAVAPHGTPITNGWPWNCDANVIFRVADLNGGNNTIAFHVPGLPFFVLHHVNAWDDVESGGIYVDVVAYENQDVLRDLSLHALRAGQFSSRGSALRRFFLHSKNGQTALEIPFFTLLKQLPSFELPTVSSRVVG